LQYQICETSCWTNGVTGQAVVTVYRPETVVAGVKQRLARQPAMSLVRIAADLKVDRHTIARDLRVVEGRTFAPIRTEMVFTAIDALLIAKRPLAVKEFANELGCSPRVASRWLERHEQWVARGRPGS
jgi:hypothetical protein